MLVKRANIEASNPGKELQNVRENPYEPSSSNEILYLQFPRLIQQDNLAHAVFTRIGGVSSSNYKSLNTSESVDDSNKNVSTNHALIKNVIQTDSLHYINQVHGNDIHILSQENNSIHGGLPQADAIITNRKEAAIMVRLADCQGIVLYDPLNGIIANIHCGWRGSVNNILGSVINELKNNFGSNPSEILAAISPSLGPCCAEFISHREIFPKSFQKFMISNNYFDFWQISRWQMINADISDENIEIAGICTRCRTDLFYSYRGEGKTGRFGVVVMLKN